MINLPLRYRRLLVPVMLMPLLLVASCGGNDDEQTSESANTAQSDSADPSANEDADSDKQRVCNLLTDEEIRDATGFDVASAEGDNFGLPVCEWELAIPESAGVAGLPLISLVLLPEADYRSRVEPLLDSLRDIEGPADEMKLHFVGGGDTGIPARATLFALKRTQGFQIGLGFEAWDNEAAASSALVDLTGKIFDRI